MAEATRRRRLRKHALGDYKQGRDVLVEWGAEGVELLGEGASVERRCWRCNLADHTLPSTCPISELRSGEATPWLVLQARGAFEARLQEHAAVLQRLGGMLFL